MPRSRIGIFRNECIRSIPLDPKLIFWCLSYNFGALEIVWLTYNTRCKTGRTGAKVHATKSLRNFSVCFGVFRTNLVHLGPFGSLMKLGAKRAELVQKLAPRGHVGIFRNERTRSSPLDPKPMFWCVRIILVHLGPFGCLTKLGTKRNDLVQKFVSRSRVGIFRNECTRSSPLDPKLMFWCVRTILVHLGPFG